jgi:hypothetical protein
MTMSSDTPTDPTERAAWHVLVTVPADLPAAQRDSLFGLVANAVHTWEPSKRDGWDADVCAGPDLSTIGPVATPAAQPDDREFAALPEDWRELIGHLEADEYDAATAEGFGPSQRVREAYSAGLMAAAELFGSWITPAAQPDDEAAIERMARALHRRALERREQDLVSNDEADSDWAYLVARGEDDEYREDARAALAALGGKQHG